MTVPRPPAAKRLKRLLRYGLVRLLLALLRPLPLSLTRPLGLLLGRAGYALAGRERAKALASLQRAFPELPAQQHARLARACFEHLMRAALEAACVDATDRYLETLVHWDAADRAVLDGALARGRGVAAGSPKKGTKRFWARVSWSMSRPRISPALSARSICLTAPSWPRQMLRTPPRARKRSTRRVRRGSLVSLAMLCEG